MPETQTETKPYHVHRGSFHVLTGSPGDYDVLIEHRVLPGPKDPVALIPDRVDYTITVAPASPKPTEDDVRQAFREQVYDALAEWVSERGDPFPPSYHFPATSPVHDIAESVIELMIEAYNFGAAS